ncbi:MAG TPA: FecR domain-containing protein [Polyangiaceae bacterium]|nr:FecR domain-containing protein [Polyangiaceae bacterium]
MKPGCPRLFEVEAWRDGRLGGAEAERFRAHLKLCPSCATEMQSLEALGEALRAPLPHENELHVRRERTKLLAAFDARLVPPPRPWRSGLALVAAVATLTCVVLAAAFRFVRPAPAPTVASHAAPVSEAVAVRADSSARWSRQADAQLETIRLESGALSIRVDHAASPRRLRVILPDGELEDIGTTFSVSADSGHTTRVSVQEGSVVLRLRGAPPVALGAGDSWSPSPAPLSASLVPPSAAPPSAKPVIVAASPSSRVPPATGPDPSDEFAAAMAALDRSDDSQAAALFGAFVAQHPRDARAEDACYLRVLAFQRAGNTNAMRRAARDYLTRYPRGFRKSEIEPLVGE